MIVEADFGNSSIKWRIIAEQDSRLVRAGTGAFELLERECRALEVRKYRLAFVRSWDDRKNSVVSGFRQGVGHVCEAVVEATYKDLQCGYDRTEELGVDRWLAMIGCYEQGIRDFVVMDLGTALTVDYVRNGVHLGGEIAPGRALLRRALKSGAGLDFNETTHGAGPGAGTQDCIAAGVEHMFGAYVVGIVARAKRLIGREVAIVVTGGDLKFAEPLLPSARFEPDLVLDGLRALCAGKETQ